ncbi:MAG: DUF4350 domain-containing protein [Pseudomonadota bacterium]
MSAPVRRGWRALVALLCVALAAGAVWLWFDAMERHWEARARPSQAATENRMLAAMRWLERHRYNVHVERTLGDANLNALPDGTLILANNTGQMSVPQADAILAWVRRGNTLLMQAQWHRQTGDDASATDGSTSDASAAARARRARLPPLTDADPIGTRLGVMLSYRSKPRTSCDTTAPPPPDSDDDEEEQDEEDGDSEPAEPQAGAPASIPRAGRMLTCVTLPRGTYPLAIDSGLDVLTSGAKARAPLWGDQDGASLRAYEEGRGRIVMVSANYFDNDALALQDHAELLLGLAGLNAKARDVTIVQRLDVLRWYAVLWQSARPLLVGLGVLLALLAWRAMRRFGPLLPEPETERRSLLEHIEASGNWLWRAPGGRAVLLAAARQETDDLLRRRAPELQALTEAERAARLARLCAQPLNDMRAALHGPAAPQAGAFARQIQILQQVRQRHERH